MVEIKGSEYEVDCQLVLIAAGFLGSEDYVTKAFKVETDGRTNVKQNLVNMLQVLKMYLQQGMFTEASH